MKGMKFPGMGDVAASAEDAGRNAEGAGGSAGPYL